jgi:hypothetical protein
MVESDGLGARGAAATSKPWLANAFRKSEPVMPVVVVAACTATASQRWAVIAMRPFDIGGGGSGSPWHNACVDNGERTPREF